MRRPGTVLVVALFAAVLAGPAAAQDQEVVNPLDVLIDAFDAPEGIEYVARLVTAPITGLSTNPDPVGDFEHPTGQDPGFTPDHIDLTKTSSTNFDAGPLGDDLFGSTDLNGFWAPTGSFHVEPPNYEPFHTFTGEEIHDGSQYQDGAVLFGFTLAETPQLPVPGRCEYVVWINDLSRGPTFINHPSFPGDPARGTNVAFGLRINPEGEGVSSTFTFEYQEASGFTNNFETDVRSFITPNYVGITVPTSQLGEMAAINFYTFCMEKGTTSSDPAMSGADQTGLVDLAIGDLGLVAIKEHTIAVPTTTTVAETTTTTLQEDVGDTTVEAGATTEEGGAFSWWLVLVAGGLGLAIAAWFFFRGNDPCKKLHDDWLAADRMCDETQSAADRAADDCGAAELELKDLDQKRKDLCKAWPPACWETEEGNWMEDSQGNRITSRDVHMRKLALGDVWDDYKAGKMTAQEVEAQWQQMDTREFRNKMKQMESDYKTLLREIDSEREPTKEAFDSLCEKAAKAQEKADNARSEAEEERVAYEKCVAAEDAAAGSGTTSESDEDTDGVAPS